MELAVAASKRATCDRAKVGAVIVKDKRVLSTGYNGSPSGLPHCSEVGHEMINGHCIRTIHAEMNAITMAAKHGININDSELYITHFPCYNCFKVVANVGIKKVYYKEDYRIEDKILDIAKRLEIELKRVDI